MRLKRVGIFLLQSIVTGAGIWYVFHDPDKRKQIAEALRHADKFWLVVGCASYGVVEILATIRWRVLLRIQGITINWLHSFGIVMVGLFFNMFLPGLVGGDAMRLYLAFRKAPRQKVRVTLSVMMDRLFGLFSILFLATVVVVFRFHWLERSRPSLHLVYIALGFLALGFSGAILLLFAANFGVTPKLVRRLPFREMIIRTFEALKVYGANPFAMAPLFLITIASHLAYYFSYYCAVQSLQPGTDRMATLSGVLSIMPLVNTITSLPISVGGLGVREALFQQLLSGLVNVPSAIAAFGASLGFAIQAAWGAVGAATYLLWCKTR